MAEKTEEKPISAEAQSVVESKTSIQYNTLFDGEGLSSAPLSEAQQKRDREDHVHRDFGLHPEFKNFLKRYEKRCEQELDKLSTVNKEELEKQQARVSAYRDVLKELSEYEREARKILTRNSH